MTVLTDSSGIQALLNTFLDLAQPHLDHACHERATFDANHVFNANFIWSLPVQSKVRLRQGWTVDSIVTWQSGAPVSILSLRSALNSLRRSGQNAVSTSLTKPRLGEIA